MTWGRRRERLFDTDDHKAQRVATKRRDLASTRNGRSNLEDFCGCPLHLDASGLAETGSFSMEGNCLRTWFKINVSGLDQDVPQHALAIRKDEAKNWRTLGEGLRLADLKQLMAQHGLVDDIARMRLHTGAFRILRRHLGAYRETLAVLASEQGPNTLSGVRNTAQAAISHFSNLGIDLPEESAEDRLAMLITELDVHVVRDLLYDALEVAQKLNRRGVFDPDAIVNKALEKIADIDTEEEES
jgi:hypothetical protein